jgi:SAM-dependent methyltransferase
MEEHQLLREQAEYYQARAAEYHEWFLREGRYDRGPEHRSQWFGEVAAVEAALHDALRSGEVLELACGTGLWTQHLVEQHSRVVAVDASPEAIAINRERLQSDVVEYVVADLFAWVPPADGGWRSVRRCG